MQPIASNSWLGRIRGRRPAWVIVAVVSALLVGPGAAPPLPATAASTAGGGTASGPMAGPGVATPATDAAVSSADPVLVAAGDIACDPASPYFNGGAGDATHCRQRATSNVMLAQNPDLVLTLGDNQYENGALSKFRASYDPSWGRAKAKTRPVVGNHEYGTSGAAGYFDYFGAAAGPRDRGYYAYNIGAYWRAYALNSYCVRIACGTTSPQYRWLSADLDANQGRNVLAYWHHARYSSGEHGDDTAMDPMWDLLHAKGADVVLAAHDHDYERFAPIGSAGNRDDARGIRSFVVGTGGKSHYSFPGARRTHSVVRNSTAFGVLRLVLHPRAYTWRFIPEPGHTFTDSGSSATH